MKVGVYATGVNANADKFTSDMDDTLIFVEDGQYIKIVKAMVINQTLSKKYGSLESAISAAASGNVLELIQDIYIDKTHVIPSGKALTIVTRNLAGTTTPAGIYRKSGFNGVMFDVKGTLNLNSGNNSAIALTVTGLTTATESMFKVSGSLVMNLKTTLTALVTETSEA